MIFKISHNIWNMVYKSKSQIEISYPLNETVQETLSLSDQNNFSNPTSEASDFCMVYTNVCYPTAIPNKYWTIFHSRILTKVCRQMQCSRKSN